MGRVTPESVTICQNSISAQAGHKEGTKLSTGLPTTSSCVELSLENLQSIFEPHSPCRTVHQTSLIPRLSPRLGMRLAPNTVKGGAHTHVMDARVSAAATQRT